MVLTGLLWIQGTAGLLSYAPAQFQNTVTILSTLDVELGLFSAHQGAHIFGDVLTVDTAGTFNSTLDVFGNFTVHSGATAGLAGNTTIGLNSTKTLDVEATATFNAPTSLNSTTDCFDDFTVHAGATSTLYGNTQLGLNSSKTLDVEATATFNGPATLNSTVDLWGPVVVHTSGSLAVNGPTTLNGNVTLGDSTSDIVDVPGQMTIHKALGFTFQGRVPRRLGVGTDANLSFDAKTTNYIWVPQNGVSTSGRTYSIDTSSTGDGDEVIVSYSATASTRKLSIVELGGGTLCTFTISDGTRQEFRLMRVNGSWRSVGQSVSNTALD